jgi:hypothetical protein
MRRSSFRFNGRSPRRSARLACQLVRERDFRLIADRIVDLSPAGLLVGPADPVLTGQRLLLSFCLPGSSYWIDGEAVVTRVVHGRRPGEYSRGLGLSLEGLSPFARMMLERTLLSLPPVPPGLRPGRRHAPVELLRTLASSFPRGADSLPEW